MSEPVMEVATMDHTTRRRPVAANPPASARTAPDEIAALMARQWAEAAEAESAALERARQLLAEAYALLEETCGVGMAAYKFFDLAEVHRPPRSDDAPNETWPDLDRPQ